MEEQIVNELQSLNLKIVDLQNIVNNLNTLLNDVSLFLAIVFIIIVFILIVGVVSNVFH